MKKTMNDLARAGQRDSIVRACLERHDTHPEEMTLLDALITAVCLLAAEKEALLQQIIQLQRRCREPVEIL